MVANATLEACLVHAPPHRIGGAGIFQMLPQKITIGGRTTMYALSKQHRSRPHAPLIFFNNI
jgi:hypothetical protein